MENLDPPPPKSKMGKWRISALRAASSVIWGGGGGGGGGGGFLFHFILSKIVAIYLLPALLWLAWTENFVYHI